MDIHFTILVLTVVPGLFIFCLWFKKAKVNNADKENPDEKSSKLLQDSCRKLPDIPDDDPEESSKLSKVKTNSIKCDAMCQGNNGKCNSQIDCIDCVVDCLDTLSVSQKHSNLTSDDRVNDIRKSQNEGSSCASSAENVYAVVQKSGARFSKKSDGKENMNEEDVYSTVEAFKANEDIYCTVPDSSDPTLQQSPNNTPPRYENPVVQCHETFTVHFETDQNPGAASNSEAESVVPQFSRDSQDSSYISISVREPIGHLKGTIAANLESSGNFAVENTVEIDDQLYSIVQESENVYEIYACVEEIPKSNKTSAVRNSTKRIDDQYYSILPGAEDVDEMYAAIADFSPDHSEADTYAAIDDKTNNTRSHVNPTDTLQTGIQRETVLLMDVSSRGKDCNAKPEKRTLNSPLPPPPRSLNEEQNLEELPAKMLGSASCSPSERSLVQGLVHFPVFSFLVSDIKSVDTIEEEVNLDDELYEVMPEMRNLRAESVCGTFNEPNISYEKKISGEEQVIASTSQRVSAIYAEVRKSSL